AHVVVPETTSKFMIEKIKAEGCEVTVSGKNWNESDPIARKLCEQKGYYYIPPFDHPLLWEGHATMIHEAQEAMPITPDAVILSVGGGGLLCGVAKGMSDTGWNTVPIYAVETLGAHSYHQACSQDK